MGRDPLESRGEGRALVIPRETPPEWVFFDVGETLVHPHPSFGAAVAEVAATVGVEVDVEAAERVADRRIAEFLDHVEAHGRGSFSIDHEISRGFWISFYRGFLIDLGVGESDADLVAPEVYTGMTRPERYAVFDDAPPLLEKLSDAGIRMAVVSNYEAFLDELLDELGIGHFLEVRAISGIEGIEKPDLRIYERALERAGVTPDQTVHIGDDPRLDAEPASALGMGAILIDRRGRHPDAGWPVVETLAGVPSLLGI